MQWTQVAKGFIVPKLLTSLPVPTYPDEPSKQTEPSGETRGNEANLFSKRGNLASRCPIKLTFSARCNNEKLNLFIIAVSM